MKIEAIKNINVTVLFSAPINHLLISQKDLLDMFKSGDQQKDQHTFIEAPSLKVVAFPNLKKDIAFENVRFLINDKTENINDSKIIIDLQKIINSNMVEKEKITAFGFNYDVIISPENDDFKIKNLVGTKISEISNIKSAGVNILYEKNNTTYILEIKPINTEEKEQKFLAHFNAHFNKKELPNEADLKNGIVEQFNEFKNIIEKI